MTRTLLFILLVVGCFLPNPAVGNELTLILNEKIFVRKIRCDQLNKKYEISFNDGRGVLRLKVKLIGRSWSELEEQCMVRGDLINKEVPEYRLNLARQGISVSREILNRDSGLATFIGPDNIQVIIEVPGPSRVTDIPEVGVGETIFFIRLSYTAGAFLGQAR